MSMSRRDFLQTGITGAAVLAASAAGLLPRLAMAQANSAIKPMPTSSLAPGDNRKEFDVRTLDEVVKALGGSKAEKSSDIVLNAPDIAEDGSVVPVTVESKLPDTKMIAMVDVDNPHALLGIFHIPAGTDPFVSARVKVGETSLVTALVQTSKGFFYTDKLVKVTLGGCGG